MAKRKPTGLPPENAGGPRPLLRTSWRILRRAALVCGFLVLTFIVSLFFWSDWYADLAVEQLFANARAPADRELPITAHAISYASSDVQPVGGQGDILSCSVPGFLERAIFPRRGELASISLRMRQACAVHDYCYRHGAATYGYTQADCDYLLLEHAYRICRFINTQFTVSKCVTDARKVLLGVRLGGREAFKHSDRLTPALRDADEPCGRDKRSPLRDSSVLADDSCTSSYFEFNPYPIRSRGYTVYRVADAPESSEPMKQKALYMFEIRPTGTQVTIVAFTKDGDEPRCTRLRLPGRFDHLSVPPLVVRSSGDGELGEDWFVWWRRFDLDQTGGQLAVLAPRRAAMSDWTKLFPGAGSRDNEESERQHPAERCEGLILGGATASNARPAWRVLQIGEKSDGRDDAEFSELHPAPGFKSADGTIRLMALRTHSCGRQKRPWFSTKSGEIDNRNVNILCFHDIVVDPAKAGDQKHPDFQKSEPYVLRDAINRWHEGTVHGDRGDGFEPDRYRNFVTPPIPMAGYIKPQARLLARDVPALAFLRRGERRGETYEETALLRRAIHRGDIGGGLPVIRLAGFEEWADPVAVLGRTGVPQLIALREDRDDGRRIKIYRWAIPHAKKKNYPNKVGEDCARRPIWDDERSLNDCARAIVSRATIADVCTQQLDSSWLVRRPIVLPPASRGDIGDVVFTRITISRADAGKSGKQRFELHARIAAIKATGDCKLLSSGPHRLPPIVDQAPSGAASHKLQEWQEKAGVVLADLRAEPVLVADLDQNERFIIFPNSKRARETKLFKLPAAPP
jgi:hypothetical protein